MPESNHAAAVIDAQDFSPSLRLASRSLPEPVTTFESVDPRSADDASPFPFPQFLSDETDNLTPAAEGNMPIDFIPWWRSKVMNRQRERAEPYPINLDALVISALAYSDHIQAISEDVLVQETAVLEAQAEFDTQTFVESKLIRNSDPIGNVLETGGPPRLREMDWGVSAGLRKRTPLGGSWEMSQRFGLHDSNSRFFVPDQQGNAQLSLSFSQPLLNGAGRAYNTALVLLADIDTSVAMDQTSLALQDHLVRVVEAYWELYLQRTVFIQKQRHVERARDILEELDRRRELDALESQIVRAQAAVATRRAELVRAVTSVRNTEARIRALTNAPELLANPYMELVPSDPPYLDEIESDLRQSMILALQNRPEIDAASQQIRAASIRQKMSRNELLPALDLVLETYVAGLRGEHDIAQSWVDQFSVGEPSYTAGFTFEVPYGRRAARARLQRRQLLLRKLTRQFDETVQMLLTDVETAVREVAATYQIMQAKYQAMQAAEVEVDYSTQRWKLLSGDDRSASFLLEDLLDAQDRLAAEELGFAVAQRDYTISTTQLKQATGTLLRHERIEPIRSCECGMPRLQFQKFAAPVVTEQVFPLPAPQQELGGHE
jgi:outer membrane protein